jgi:hypothetical protein
VNYFINKYILTLLIVSLLILPISFNFFKYTALISFLVIFIKTVIPIINSGSVRPFPFGHQLTGFIFIFIFGFIGSVINDVNLIFAIKDSIGFLVYLMFPILYLYIDKYDLFTFYRNLVVRIIIILAFLHIILYVAYYLIFTDLTLVSLTTFNEVLYNYGLDWQLSASGGILRINSNAGHYFLLGMALLCIDFLKNKGLDNVLFIIIVLASILADGHRILVISAGVILLAAYGLMFLQLNKFRLYFILIFSISLITIFNIDFSLLSERFEFNSSSTSIRLEQIPALLNEIDQKPLFGNGFGSNAVLIRSEERPFMYEVEFFAVMMKIGIVGFVIYSALYFSIYKFAINYLYKLDGIVFVSLGIAYYLFMFSNGGMAMSPISAIFHIISFLMIFSLQKNNNFGL